ncbi:Protein N-acetyltransferase, RimJ/RimL family [Nocardioides scoriae]|uniref:Protein N-acetyltransferase, RimJ/RimL family n=1 Tax=Nocardioides scoriae TaxID=642780 RepID=A0A1H1VAL7_9ACTN|nr:GNAT family N-acetyltransferase [Nocardioides scoriae]SDS81680.1 Protein N-acetyltransferase, RimJ/RimL family [Nocardioides scoriae]
MTARLVLARPAADDLDEVHALHADPAVWQHFPRGRHRTAFRTVQLLETFDDAWQVAGLGVWVARLREADGDHPAGTLAGVGGCSLRGDRTAWNLYYRFDPAFWGRGYAAELARAALDAARRLRPATPVVASLLEHNTASQRLAERLGLALAWRGVDPRGEGVRRLHADRPLDPVVLDAILAGMAGGAPGGSPGRSRA